MNNAGMVQIRVPGSTSNCGPGFDCLGIALRLYNTVAVRFDSPAAPLAVELAGNGRDAMLDGAARAFFAAAQLPPRGRFAATVTGDVPRARGLGSSVTVRAGMIAALNEFHRAPLDRPALAALVAQLEGHPDNAAAAVFGGFCVSRTGADGRLLDAQRIEIDPALQFVVVSPELEIETAASRRRLPASLPFHDAVRSLNSLAFLVAAFATRDYRRLRGAIDDRVHEPHRLPGIPGAAAAIAAGVAAGAIAGWLSGSGSTVICIAETPDAQAAEQAMAAAFARSRVACTTRIVSADNAGLQIVR